VRRGLWVPPIISKERPCCFPTGSARNQPDRVQVHIDRERPQPPDQVQGHSDRGRPQPASPLKPSISEGGNLSGVKRPDINLAGKKRLPRNPPGFLTRHKSVTRDPLLYFPPEGRHAVDFLRPKKNPTASAGFEPAILGTRGQHANP
jgi:hypothetical protein